MTHSRFDADAPLRVERRDEAYALVGVSVGLSEANVYLKALRARGLSVFTIRAYAFDLLLLLRWLQTRRLQLLELSEAHLLEFVAYQREIEAEPRSINRRLSTTRLFLRFVSGDELPAASGVSLPAPHYKGPGRDHHLGLHRLTRRRRLKLRVKEAQKLVEPLAPQQVRAFIRALTRYRDLAIIHLMLLCGLRSREVLDLELGDIAFADSRLRVRGKGGRERALPLPEILARTLRQYLELERPKRCVDPRLFVVLQSKRRGQPMTTAGLRSLFRHRRRNRALSSANPHRFRHTFGADMSRAGVRLPILQRLMGHADMKITLQYVQLSLADVADEYRRAMAEIDKRYGRRR